VLAIDHRTAQLATFGPSTSIVSASFRLDKPGGERSRMIEPGRSGHRNRAVARDAARQVTTKRNGFR